MKKKKKEDKDFEVADRPCNLPTLDTLPTQLSENEQLWKRRIQAYGVANTYPQVRLSSDYVIQSGQTTWNDFLSSVSQEWEQAYLDIRDRCIQKV